MGILRSGVEMRERLPDFIEAHSREIVDQAALVAISFMHSDGKPNADQLREHLPQILNAVVEDLRTTQSRATSIRRAQTPVLAPAVPSSAAGAYARLRAQGGVTIEQIVSEIRALRASVLRLWSDASASGEHALRDMTRFNEAIDQILAEILANFSAEIEGWRNVFIATLAHDLRGPLSVNVLTADVLANITPEGTARLLVDRLQRSGARMKSLLDSLLDYSKASLGGGIRVSVGPADLDPDLRDEIDLLRALFSEHAISYETGGDTTGVFDVSRIREALANLVINAAKHGAASGPIRVSLDGDGYVTKLTVQNIGPSIPANKMSGLFMPFGHLGDAENVTAEADSLGLGLFIVRQIALAHGGNVTASSENGSTIFSVTLPSVTSRAGAP